MYLICFEVERSGFILEGFRDLGMAKEVAEKLFLMINNSYMVVNQELGAMEMMEWKMSYRIKGNMSYISGSAGIRMYTSNGAMTYYIIDTELGNFDLQMFIRERENSSYPLSLEELVDLDDAMTNLSDDELELNDLCDELEIPNWFNIHFSNCITAN